MMVRDDKTTVIQGWLDRHYAGDDSAYEALLASASERLTRLTHKMLKRYPGVHRWEQTDDVLQNALVRLDRALRSMKPRTALDFFRLAATQIRRELIDLARHYSGPRGMGANLRVHADANGKVRTDAPENEPADSTHEPSRLAIWTEFHAQIDALSDADRQLFDLLWYQGLTQAEAAHVLGISERTINKRWVAARMKLGTALDGRLPV